jgi:hypothetical protein
MRTEWPGRQLEDEKLDGASSGEKQIPSLRCGMTNKRTDNGNSRSPSGMTTREATTKARG